MRQPPVDVETLSDLSDDAVRASATPPLAYAAYTRLIDSLQLLGVPPNPSRPGDATKRALLDQFASGLDTLG